MPFELGLCMHGFKVKLWFADKVRFSRNVAVRRRALLGRYGCVLGLSSPLLETTPHPCMLKAFVDNGGAIPNGASAVAKTRPRATDAAVRNRKAFLAPARHDAS